MKLWVVGKFIGTSWELQGVFDTEEKAKAICKGDLRYFVGPVTLNEELPEEPIPWPGAYYPKIEPEVKDES